VTTDSREELMAQRRVELITRLKKCGKGEYRNILITELESVMISEILLGMIKPAITKEEDAYAVVLVNQQGENIFVLPMESQVLALKVSSDLRQWMRVGMEKLVGVYGNAKDEIQLKEDDK